MATAWIVTTDRTGTARRLDRLPPGWTLRIVDRYGSAPQDLDQVVRLRALGPELTVLELDEGAVAARFERVLAPGELELAIADVDMLRQPL